MAASTGVGGFAEAELARPVVKAAARTATAAGRRRISGLMFDPSEIAVSKERVRLRARREKASPSTVNALLPTSSTWIMSGRPYKVCAQGDTNIVPLTTKGSSFGPTPCLKRALSVQRSPAPNVAPFCSAYKVHAGRRPPESGSPRRDGG